MQHETIWRLEQEQVKKDLPEIRIGDTVQVQMRVREGDKERIQTLQGVVIARRGSNHRETITLRKESYWVGVEWVIPIHAPVVEGIRVLRHSKVRRAKLYFLRQLRGRKARLTERRIPRGAEKKKTAQETTAPTS